MDRFVVEIEALATEVHDLRDTVAEKDDRNKRILIALVVAIAVGFLTAAAAVAVAVEQREQNSDLEAVVETQERDRQATEERTCKAGNANRRDLVSAQKQFSETLILALVADRPVDDELEQRIADFRSEVNEGLAGVDAIVDCNGDGVADQGDVLQR